MSYHPFRENCMYCDGVGTVEQDADSVIKHTCMRCLGTGYHEYGSFETFYTDGMGDAAQDEFVGDPGWYWWPCYQGCLPEGEAIGPFKTEDEAIADARD